MPENARDTTDERALYDHILRMGRERQWQTVVLPLGRRWYPGGKGLPLQVFQLRGERLRQITGVVNFRQAVSAARGEVLRLERNRVG